MSCYHPLIGIWKGDYTDSGKKKYEIHGNLDPTDCPSVYDKIVIPCGHCIGCRLDYSRSWADRMMLELETAGCGIFVTLTYDNVHIHWSSFDENGDPEWNTLDKRDFQLFMKRLRREFDGSGDLPFKKIRFYAAGEYGSNTHRSHMHCILFGLNVSDFPDIKPHGKNELGQLFYSSERFARIWSNGFCLISDVSWKTCAYVARYVTKKLNGDAAMDYAVRNCIPEFALMSRKPGLGREYLDKHPECLDYEKINLSTSEGGLEIRLPKYYLKQLKLTDPDRYDKIMEQRKQLANDSMLLQLQNTNLSYLEYLEVKENQKLNCVKSLKRE